jgi:hypothetical protein
MTPLLIALLLALPASADSIDPRFHVVDESPFVHHTSTGFRTTGKLRDPQTGRKAGHERTRCLFAGPAEAQCLGVVHLNGRVGGTGKLRFAGDIGADEQRVRVTGGSGDFEAVRGKLTFRGLGEPDRTRFRFDLRRPK